MAWSVVRLNAALDTLANAATYAQLHTADPGTAGTTGIASGVDRAAVTWGAASAQDKQGTATWIIPAPGGPFTFLSLWTAATGGTFCGSGALAPAETFAGSGSLAVTIDAPAS